MAMMRHQFWPIGQDDVDLTLILRGEGVEILMSHCESRVLLTNEPVTDETIVLFQYFKLLLMSRVLRMVLIVGFLNKICKNNINNSLTSL